MSIIIFKKLLLLLLLLKFTEETMYAYADFGETKKRTLEAGDITGVQKLYS